MRFRFAVLPLTFLTLFSSLRAEAPQLLATAMQKLVAGDDQWAYTQVFRRTDRTGEDTVARFDPSKPAAAQWELMKLHGHAPSAAETERWLIKRSQNGPQTDGRALVGLLDMPRATICGQDDRCVRFQIPLRQNTIGRVPTGNFMAFAEVDRTEQALQRFSVVLRQSIQLMGGVAEIETAQGEVFFKSFDDSDTTRPSYIMASGSGQALFHRINRSAEVIYQDQRRVKS